MLRLTSLLMLPLLAACTTDATPRPSIAVVRADPCAALQGGGLVDPREPGMLGCANAVNLRLMVANPRDLERGTETTRARDDQAIAAAKRHRLGKVPALSGEVSGTNYSVSKKEAN